MRAAPKSYEPSARRSWVGSPGYSIVEECAHISTRFFCSFCETGSSQRGPTHVAPSEVPSALHAVLESFFALVRRSQYCGRKFHASEEDTKLWRSAME